MPLDKDSSILITGAGGVLGRALLKALEKNGFANVHAPTRNELDLLDAESTLAWFKNYSPDSVIHLASVVFGLAGNIKNQFRSAIENTIINTNFFAALQRSATKRCFFAGTVASYPYPYQQMPLTEDKFFDGLPHYGEFGYAMAKRHAYTFLNIMSQEYGLKTCYGIFTNLYGEHDRFDIENGHVIPSLIAKARDAHLKGAALEVWGDGSAERDFLHADDAAQAIILCLSQETPPELINISSNQAVTIAQVADIIAQSSEVKGVKFLTDKPTGIPKRIICNSQLKALGFRQNISIRDGLASTCEWYKSNREEIRK